MNVYDFTVKDAQGQPLSLADYEGKVLLIVNTAIKCGLTPQYEGLEALYEKYRDQGLEILDFPCNQFLEQAPGTVEEISEFCTLTYGTTFPRFGKVAVNGADADPLFVWLKQQKPVALGDEDTAKFESMVAQYTPDNADADIKWNFNKFLIARNGDVIDRFSPAYKPEQLEAAIQAALA
jgi:glutathione peroxidase